MKKIVLATVLAAGMATSASAQTPPIGIFGTLGGIGGAVTGVLTFVIVTTVASGSSTTTTN